MLNRGATEAWIVGAVRTPIGRHGGALSAVRPDDLARTVTGRIQRFKLRQSAPDVHMPQQQDELA